MSAHARSGPKGRRPCLAGQRRLEPCELTPGRWVSHEAVHTKPALPLLDIGSRAFRQFDAAIERDRARALEAVMSRPVEPSPARPSGNVEPAPRPRRVGGLAMALMFASIASLDLGPSPRRR